MQNNNTTQTIADVCSAVLEKACDAIRRCKKYLRQLSTGAVLSAAALGLGFFSHQSAQAAAQQNQPPNIIFILADDLGWTDINCRKPDGSPTPAGQFDSTYYQTPNLAALRNAGVRFSHAYACPQCSPTRVCLRTGQYPARLQWSAFPTDNVTQWQNPQNLALVGGFTRRQLPLETITIAEALRNQKNYASFFVGKLHANGLYSCPSPNAFQPHLPQNGFDYFVGGGVAGNYWEHHWNDRIISGLFGPDIPNSYWGKTQPNNNDEYVTDSLTIKSLQFIDKTTQPYYLYLAHGAVHDLIIRDGQPDAKHGPPPLPDYVKWYKLHPDPRNIHNNPAYAAMIASLDESVGAIMNKINPAYQPYTDYENYADPCPAAFTVPDNTYIIFYSDNGGEEIHTGKENNKITENQPLRGDKRQLYEGGVRVPLIIVGPHTAPPPGAQPYACSIPVNSCDFFPTFLNLALGSDYQPQNFPYLDGDSMLPLIQCPDQNHNDPHIFRRVHFNPDHSISTDPLFEHRPFWSHDHDNENHNIDSPPWSFVQKRINGADYKLIKFYDQNYSWNQNPDLSSFHHDSLKLKYDAPGSCELYLLSTSNPPEQTPDNSNSWIPRDLGEQNDLYDDNHPDPSAQAIVELLKPLLENWLADTNAPMPMPQTVNLTQAQICAPILKKTTVIKSALQNAIDHAADGDTIVLCPGVHSLNKTINLFTSDQPKNITLKSIDPTDPQIVANTILYANHSGPVVQFHTKQAIGSHDCILDGLTITHGTQSGIDGGFCQYRHPGPADVIISHCVIRNNTTSANGGGLVNFHGTISHSTISDNTALGAGGGLAQCHAQIDNSLIVNNLAHTNGGGLNICYANITNCTIAGNIARGPEGGGLRFCSTGKNMLISNSIVWGNFNRDGLDQIHGPSHVANSCIQDQTPNDQSTYPGPNNLDDDPLFTNYWTDYHFTTNASTAYHNLIIDNPNLFPPQSTIEFNHDGVPRTVQNTTNHTIQFLPPITPKLPPQTLITLWPPNTTSTIENYQLKTTSPAKNLGPQPPR